MHKTCAATPAGLGSSRSRWRARSCEHADRLQTPAAAAQQADGHRHFRCDRPLRNSRVLLRSLTSC